MSKKLYIDGSSIIKDDNGDVLEYSRSGSFMTERSNFFVVKDSVTKTEFSIDPSDAVNWFSDKDGTIPYTEESMRTFLRGIRNFNIGEEAPIQKEDIFNGGFVDYNDNATKTTPLVVTVAGSPVTLTNDGLGAFTNKNYLPNGVTDVWNTSTNSFDWSELNLGDMVDIRLDLDIVTTSPNTEIKIDLYLGTGVNEYTIPFATDQNFKSIGTHKINKFNGIYMGDSNTLDNGGKFKITTDSDCSVIINGWYCKIIKKG